ncbi:hypothetical protein EJ06DRAFT_497479 [Trichodelitschia bisporula]|uniref:Clathrin light chain n=1 Tax=Trichodelitschia bisporula TaxID=703511 RepID=A0A6G1HQ52_9PEZI|nr:hypothetical protein EJ06DRAFT_497479 [Trichodelitschia bisporula]
MAERFPSLEEIDAGQTEVHDIGAGTGNATSFLDRERALLGDDADQFATPNDNLASVEDAGDDDLLGGGASYDTANEEMSGFESAFPAIDTTNDHMAPGGTITGSAFLPGGPIPTSYPPPSFAEPEEEPDVIREWRERRALAIQHRDEISAERKAQTVNEAQQAIDDFYEAYNDKKDKHVAQARQEAEEFLNSRDDTTAGGTSWERIAKLVDLSGKGVKGGAAGGGKERFRELLLSLRKDENAPGASGY